MRKMLLFVSMMACASYSFAADVAAQDPNHCDLDHGCGNTPQNASRQSGGGTVSGASGAPLIVPSVPANVGSRGAQAGAVSGALGTALNAFISGGGNNSAPAQPAAPQVNFSQLQAVADKQAAADVSRALQNPANNPFGSQATNSSQAAPTTDPNKLDLGANCDQAQQNATAYINQLASAQGATQSVCRSAQTNKQAGQVMLRVALMCQNVPTWQQMRDAANQMIQQANQTIAGSCL
jgi:hypothetical protein